MVNLTEITEENRLEVGALSIDDRQKKFLASPVGILARAYVYRNCNAKGCICFKEGTKKHLSMIGSETEN